MSLLDSTSFFLSLEEEDKKHLSYFCQEQSIKKGKELFHQGDEPNAFYVVVSGGFKVIKEIGGEIEELGPIETGDILGEMALFGESKRRNATIIAKQDSKLLVILDFSIQQLTEKYPDILEKIKLIIKARTL